MDDTNEWNDAIQEWLEKHDDDDVGLPDKRYVIPNSVTEIIETDTPEEIEREKVRKFSLRWGWIWDFFSALYWWIRDWFTVDIVGGIFRGFSVLVIAALLFAIIYNVHIAKTVRPRVLPTIDELMAVPSHDDGSPNPTEGRK